MKALSCYRWAVVGLAAFGSIAVAQEKLPRTDLQEPVFRLSKSDAGAEAPPAHPLDPALQIAYDGLKQVRESMNDYTGVMVKRERVDGALTEQEFMSFKIRNRRVQEGKITTPFSIYLKFLKPQAVAGREVIYVEGQNNNYLVAHETGWKGLVRANLDPNGWLAMSGNRYPITDAGIENLVVKLIEKGERDRNRDECEVKFFKNAKINDRVCTVLQVTHPVERPYFDFHIAQIFIDDEYRVPIRYAAYSWPKEQAGKAQLEEEYTYTDLKFNVGLTDQDFNPDNEAYEYP
jgi:hypothetical protein